MKIRKVGLAPMDCFIGCFVDESMSRRTVFEVGGVTNSFCPECAWEICTDKQCACVLNQGAVCPFRNTILLG